MQEFSDDLGMKHLLRSKYGPLKIDSERLQQLADLIADPSNCVIFHQSKSFENLANKEYYYGIQYDNVKFS